MKNKTILVLLMLFIRSYLGIAQQTIKGTVVEKSETSSVPLIGASVYWQSLAHAAITDVNGSFELPSDSLPARLIATFVGYKPDTILVSDLSHSIHFRLHTAINLGDVNIIARKDAVGISTIKTINAENITQRELLKAACCNLSEAFETNPTVNVAYKDAVTGSKEIRLLGLAGIYSQLMTENIPNMRGLAGIYGLTYIPGPWMESIQLTKGSGSVLNGYESTTGQINVEFKKPQAKETPRFYLNLFTDNFGGHEANTFYKKHFGKWSGIMMAHGRFMNSSIDRNGDHFMDMPDNKQINIYNRWQYDSGKKLEAQLGWKVLSDIVEGGELSAAENRFRSLYTTQITTKRLEVFGKLGFVYPETPHKSIGNIAQFTFHDMNSHFGLRSYNADEKTFYYQSIYQNIIFKKTNHEYKTGITFRYDELNQQFYPLPNRITERVAGAFLEYTYNYIDKLTIVTGLRGDLRNENELIFTPRIHAKYNFTENLIVRVSAGKSYRQPFFIADHISILATSRTFNFSQNIRAERAWNYGFNVTGRFKLNGQDGTIVLDAYRTHFLDQLVVDSYTDSSKIIFSNLGGKSFSNSLQATLNYELLERLELRMAYKIEDVQSTFNGKTEQQPLTAHNRALASVSYETVNGHWKFDGTIAREGKKRLQNVFADATKEKFAPGFYQLNLQLTKEFRKFVLYCGVENLFDFRQKDPIIHPENPFGTAFDATNVWGPIAGRRIYLGLRISIN